MIFGSSERRRKLLGLAAIRSIAGRKPLMKMIGHLFVHKTRFMMRYDNGNQSERSMFAM